MNTTPMMIIGSTQSLKLGEFSSPTGNLMSATQMLKSKLRKVILDQPGRKVRYAFNTWKKLLKGFTYSDYNIVDLKLDIKNQTLNVSHSTQWKRNQKIMVINDSLRNKILSPHSNKSFEFDFNKTYTSNMKSTQWPQKKIEISLPKGFHTKQDSKELFENSIEYKDGALNLDEEDDDDMI